MIDRGWVKEGLIGRMESGSHYSGEVFASRGRCVRFSEEGIECKVYVFRIVRTRESSDLRCGSTLIAWYV